MNAISQSRRPYVVEKRGEGYFVVVNSRTGALSSYPTGTRREANGYAATLNRAYAEVMAEEAKS